ncbi:hypothetical protein BGX21_004088, partial [Mortierella sp. AD011]
MNTGLAIITNSPYDASTLSAVTPCTVLVLKPMKEFADVPYKMGLDLIPESQSSILEEWRKPLRDVALE